MMRASPILGVFAIVLAAIFAGPGRADDTDLHALFEARCMTCHGHSGDFARRMLSVEQGRVVGSRGQPLETFLGRHQGGLPGTEVDRLLALFLEQIDSGAVFRDRCLTCHGTARSFAQVHLILRDDVLYGRYSGRPVAAFLTGHGRLDAAGAEQMTEALSDILRGGR